LLFPAFIFWLNVIIPCSLMLKFSLC
jgi:hypothetical protein